MSVQYVGKDVYSSWWQVLKEGKNVSMIFGVIRKLNPYSLLDGTGNAKIPCTNNFE